MAVVRIDVYSHNIRVQTEVPRIKAGISEYLKGYLSLYGLVRAGHNRFVRGILKVFAVANAERTAFRLHANSLNSFVDFMTSRGYISAGDVEMVRHVVRPGVRVPFRMVDSVTLRDYQIPIVDYLSADGHIKALTLQTGKGKTLCALTATVRLGVRTALVIRGMYVERWMADLKGLLNLKPGELIVVRGSKDLKKLIDLANCGQLEAKFILITNRTLYYYLEAFRDYGSCLELYGCNPDELFERLGVGLRIIDEVHQDFHFNFKLDLYTNVEKTINLSATLVNDNEFVTRMYETAYPLKMRYIGGTYDRYIAVQGLFYGIKDVSKIRFLRRSRNSYSHVDFEQSLLKDKILLQRYIAIINHVVYESYIRIRQRGQKILVFAGTVDMCDVLTSDLKKRYPYLVVNRYTSEDEYQNLMNSDICVSTLQSAGTAVDVPGLRIVFMTTAVGSQQANEQALGRLRKLPDATPMFIYLVCEDIHQHVTYHESKVRAFKDKVVSHEIYQLPIGL